ncbi:hypothetical protein MMC21_003304 [Puttea exsequens]|nr:hypothetical protein [Puttea exsequens]
MKISQEVESDDQGQTEIVEGGDECLTLALAQCDGASSTFSAAAKPCDNPLHINFSGLLDTRQPADTAASSSSPQAQSLSGTSPVEKLNDRSADNEGTPSASEDIECGGVPLERPTGFSPATIDSDMSSSEEHGTIMSWLNQFHSPPSTQPTVCFRCCSRQASTGSAILPKEISDLQKEHEAKKEPECCRVVAQAFADATAAASA